MKRPVYRQVENRYLKINPDGSVIEVNFDLLGVDVAITATRQSMVELPSNHFVCMKSSFDKAYRTAIEMNKAILSNRSYHAKYLLDKIAF